MLCGLKAFTVAVVIEDARARSAERPTNPRKHKPELDARWEKVILGCLEPDPLKRFQSATQVLAALEDRDPWLPSRRQGLLLALSALTAGSGAAYLARWSPWSLGSRASVAVLPFANGSGEPESEYLAAGLTSELRASLEK